MNELLKLKQITSDRNVKAIRLFYDNIENHVRTLDGLGINSEEYGALLASAIIERLTHQLKLIIGQNIKDKICDLTKILSIINEKLIAHKNCSITDEKGGKNYLLNNNHEENPCSRSTLVANQSFKNKCAFCKGSHQPDKYEAITDPSARK